jgi:hypothetical protein
MRSATYHLSAGAVRADALFASDLQRGDEPSVAQVDQAIAAAVGALGARGCAARVAQEYGEHPETAAVRMRWARGLAANGPGRISPASVHRPPSGGAPRTVPAAA